MELNSTQDSKNTRKTTRRSSKFQGGNDTPDPTISQPGSNWRDPAPSIASKMAGDASDRAIPWEIAAWSTSSPTDSRRKSNEKPNAPDESRSRQLQSQRGATDHPKVRCT